SLVPESRDKTPRGRRRSLSRRRKPIGVQRFAYNLTEPTGSGIFPPFLEPAGDCSGIRHPPLARISIMKSHLIIDVMTLTCYMGTGPAGARGREHRSAG